MITLRLWAFWKGITEVKWPSHPHHHQGHMLSIRHDPVDTDLDHRASQAFQVSPLQNHPSSFTSENILSIKESSINFQSIYITIRYVVIPTGTVTGPLRKITSILYRDRQAW